MSNDTPVSALQHHLDTGIQFAKNGAALYLVTASLIVALVSLTSGLSETGIPQGAAAEVGGVLFYILLAVVGWFLIMGIIFDVLVTKIAPRLGVTA